MKKILFSTVLFLLTGCALILTAKEFPLLRQGKSVPVILENNDSEVQKAVRQFNEDMIRCGNTALKVVKSVPGNAYAIRFNVEKRTVMKEDDFSITFPDAKTMLITCSPFSAGNALRYILEEYAGVRYLFPVFAKGGQFGEEINHYPSTKNLAIPRKTVHKKASYTLNRNVDWRMRSWNWRWNIRPRILNGHMIPIDVFPVYKYAVDQSWPVNVMPILKGRKFLPRKAKAPLPKNIYRAMVGYSAGWNPCFSHPDTTRIAIENILEILQKDPERVSINMGINDNGGMCECASCLAKSGPNNSVGRKDYSALYWKWVHDVAGAVTKKYPNVYFSCLAYREVLNPPSFQLHPNVVPQICFELNAMDDKEVCARRLELLKAWKAKAHVLDFWDYSYGLRNYIFPRIYFKSHSERLKLLYDHKVRSMFVECFMSQPNEGPKYYLMSKLLFDVNADPEKIVMDWCNTAVGRKAGTYLRKYYDFWEQYWKRPELKQTAWYTSRFATYMALGKSCSYTLALRKGDMKYLRALMEKVVSLAGTPEEKRRAQVLMRCFEVSEDASAILLSEWLQADGSLKNKADALAVIRQIPAALKAQERLLKNPFAIDHCSGGNLQSIMLSHMGALLPYLKDPAVKAEAEKIAADPAVPTLLRGMLKIWMGSTPSNLIANGSFEKPSPRPMTHWNEGGAARSDKKASHGKYSFRVPNCTYSFTIPAKPGKTYLFLFDAYIKEASVEGRLNYQISPRTGKKYRTHYRYLNQNLSPGRWNTFSGVCTGHLQGDNIQFMFYLRKFEKEDEVYLDNFRAYCLDDLKMKTALPPAAAVPPGKKAASGVVFRCDFNDESFWMKNPVCKTARYGFGGSHRIVTRDPQHFLEVKTNSKQIFMYNVKRDIPLQDPAGKYTLTLRIKGKGTVSFNPMGITKTGKSVYQSAGIWKINSSHWKEYTYTFTLKDAAKNKYKALRGRLNVEKNSSVQIDCCVIRRIN